jgi:uncharacterized protein (DUF1697 family)
MPHFVVLLRGINVGKANRVPMAEFRSLLEGLGHTEVRTLLNSGNAVFKSPGRSANKHAGAISTALVDRLGVDVLTVVKSATAFSAAMAENPMPPPRAEHSRFLVVFGQEAKELEALAPLIEVAQAPERFVVGASAAYVHCPSGVLESKVAKAFLGTAGRRVTSRNWATTLKIAELLDDVAH